MNNYEDFVDCLRIYYREESFYIKDFLNRFIETNQINYFKTAIKYFGPAGGSALADLLGVTRMTMLHWSTVMCSTNSISQSNAIRVSKLILKAIDDARKLKK